MWNLQDEFVTKHNNAWNAGPLKNLVPDEVESDHKKMLSTSNKLITRFENLKMNKPQAVAAGIKKSLADFKECLPIIRAFCNPGLMERHVDEICKVSLLNIQPD